VSFDELKKRCRENLSLTADNSVKLMKCISLLSLLSLERKSEGVHPRAMGLSCLGAV
jgi:hypothetical protein